MEFIMEREEEYGKEYLGSRGGEREKSRRREGGSQHARVEETLPGYQRQ